MDIFTSEEDAEEEKWKIHGIQIVNWVTEAKNGNLRDTGDSRYISTLKLIGKYKESSEDLLWTEVVPSMIYMWLGSFSSFVEVSYHGHKSTPEPWAAS